MNFLRKLFGSAKDEIRPVDIRKRFELLGRVGQGSMSKVWRAKDVRSGQIVALKVLDQEKTQKLESRFTGREKPSEGEIAVTLRHPNVVRTYEHGLTHEREQFLVMEFVEGVALSYLVDVQNEAMKTHRLKMMAQLGDGIHYLHQSKWIHRDICPRNILLTTDHDVKLIDFGLAVPDTEAFRAPGNRTGTADYMAPELIRRQATDHRIDVFSYAVTCYEMCARRRPWESVKTSDAMKQHLNTPPLPLVEAVPGIDQELAAIVMKGLADPPPQRWQSAEAMADAIRKVAARLESR
jgi:serine/threonine protein kinase